MAFLTRRSFLSPLCDNLLMIFVFFFFSGCSSAASSVAVSSAGAGVSSSGTAAGAWWSDISRDYQSSKTRSKILNFEILYLLRHKQVLK